MLKTGAIITCSCIGFYGAYRIISKLICYSRQENELRKKIFENIVPCNDNYIIKYPNSHDLQSMVKIFQPIDNNPVIKIEDNYICFKTSQPTKNEKIIGEFINCSLDRNIYEFQQLDKIFFDPNILDKESCFDGYQLQIQSYLKNKYAYEFNSSLCDRSIMRVTEIPFRHRYDHPYGYTVLTHLYFYGRNINDNKFLIEGIGSDLNSLSFFIINHRHVSFMDYLSIFVLLPVSLICASSIVCIFSQTEIFNLVIN